MGDHYVTLVDVDCTLAEAPDLAGRGLDWLIRERIVAPEPVGPCIGSKREFSPGENWAKTVDELDDDQTPACLSVVVDRRQYGWYADAMNAKCPLCARSTDFYTDCLDTIEGEIEPFDAAFESWEEDEAAPVRCRHCGRASDLRAWRWHGAMALGCLGFEFQNWPDFTDEFVSEFSRVLDGHHLERVWGKV